MFIGQTEHITGDRQSNAQKPARQRKLNYYYSKSGLILDKTFFDIPEVTHG